MKPIRAYYILTARSRAGRQEMLSLFDFDREIKRVTWQDGGADVEFKQNDGKVVIHTRPFHYGRHLVVCVAKIEC